MTTAQMLARVRTLLDEASADVSTAGFWTDDEIYSALTDGQTQIVNFLILKFKSTGKLPEALRELRTTTSGSTTATLPSNYLHYITVTAGEVPVFIREGKLNQDHYKNNTFLKSSATSPYCSFNATQIVLETNVSWVMEYIKKPTDISISVQPTITPYGDEAIVQYAFAFLLDKSKDQRAQNEFAKFLNLAQGVV